MLRGLRHVTIPLEYIHEDKNIKAKIYDEWVKIRKEEQINI